MAVCTRLYKNAQSTKHKIRLSGSFSIWGHRYGARFMSLFWCQEFGGGT